MLVKYGYYDDLEDINELIPSLLSLLSGKNDKPFPKANDEESLSYREVRRYINFFTINFLAFRKEDLKIIM